MNADIGQYQASSDSHKARGICTGITDLDKITSGMRPGSLIVIASRHLMGKSTIAQNIASHVALNVKLPVLMFNMHLSEIVATKLESALLYVDETPSQSVDEVRSRVCNVIAQHGQIGLIVIDYLQLIDPIYSVDSSAEDYEYVLSSLKALARETKATIILLSQLDPKLENRRERRPRLSDLPSTKIGQYADLLIFLYRDEYYNPEREGNTELKIGRHRYGAAEMTILGSAKLSAGNDIE